MLRTISMFLQRHRLLPQPGGFESFVLLKGGLRPSERRRENGVDI